jgi:hypothetical protein
MARLSLLQWQSIRSAWERDPRSGFSWLTEHGGGPWRVSREAIRLRAQRENWRKLPDVAPSSQQSGDDADAAAAMRSVLDQSLGTQNSGAERSMSRDEAIPSTGSSSPIGFPVPDYNALGEDPRNRLLAQHKAEWNLARGLIYNLAKEARTASGVNRGRLTKFVIDGLRSLQQAERAAHGLDVVQIRWDDLSLEQLEAIAKGKWPA